MIKIELHSLLLFPVTILLVESSDAFHSIGHSLCVTNKVSFLSYFICFTVCFFMLKGKLLMFGIGELWQA